MDIKLLRFDFPSPVLPETSNYKKFALGVVVLTALAAISALHDSLNRVPLPTNPTVIAKFFNYTRPDFGVVFQNRGYASSFEFCKVFEFIPLMLPSEKVSKNFSVFKIYKDVHAERNQTQKTIPANNQFSLQQGQTLIFKRFDQELSDFKVGNVFTHVHVQNNQTFILNSKPNSLSPQEIFRDLLSTDLFAAKKYALECVQKKSDQLNQEQVFKAFLKLKAGKESQEFASACVKMGTNCTLNQKEVIKDLLDGKFAYEAYTFILDCHQEKDRCRLNFEQLHKDLLATNPYRARWLGIRCVEAGIPLVN